MYYDAYAPSPYPEYSDYGQEPQGVPPFQEYPDVQGGNGQQPQQPQQRPFISQQICKINGKDKVMDFKSRLIPARVEDFANVHGRGGKGHAPNSTIACTICDFTKGVGDKSVSVAYRIDVEDIELLYEAAVAARLGILAGNANAGLRTVSGDVLTALRRWLGQPPQQDGRLIQDNEIIALGTALSNAMSAIPEALFSYVREKNNPYKKDEQGNVSVSGITIGYCPYRKDGQRSRYPWVIKIENYRAPLRERANGSSPHDASRAVDKRSAFIMASEDDFLASMVAIKRYVNLWEMTNLDLIRDGLYQIEEARIENQNQKLNGGFNNGVQRNGRYERSNPSMQSPA